MIKNTPESSLQTATAYLVQYKQLFNEFCMAAEFFSEAEMFERKAELDRIAHLVNIWSTIHQIRH